MLKLIVTPLGRAHHDVAPITPATRLSDALPPVQCLPALWTHAQQERVRTTGWAVNLVARRLDGRTHLVDAHAAVRPVPDPFDPRAEPGRQPGRTRGRRCAQQVTGHDQ